MHQKTTIREFGSKLGYNSTAVAPSGLAIYFSQDSISTMSPKSAPSAFSMDDFAKALEAESVSFEKGSIVKGKVFSHDTNGAYVDIKGKSLAFVPIEEITAGGGADLEALVPIGEDMDFLVVRDQDADGQVTLSRRQLQVRYAWVQVEEIQERKESVTVRVTGVNKGGVTVDFQGLRGFIPKSQLVDRDLEALKGSNVTALIIEASQERDKFVLSQRQATRTANFSTLQMGQLITGQVVSLKPFGAFVDFDGNTGLLHIKQISQEYIKDLSAVFSIGQEIKALIVNLDEGTGKISLSTRVLENKPGEMVNDQAEVMNSADARAPRAAQKLFGGGEAS
jgi:small subunit ribosomal protein S1